MKHLIKSIRFCLVSVLIQWTLDVCPNGKFKDSFASYLKRSIHYLIEQIEDEEQIINQKK